ncbi:MAG: serine/threonine protein kinase [Oscillatoriales cyanobacterium C42_A2020_001]|nr:serine/threonine protein kinase [Leptolyngbyaceae cyanobacterium C42_A2020_001]
MTQSQNDQPSEILQGRYKIQQCLGKKAGRQTFLAQDLQTQEQVVVKRLTFNKDISWDDIRLFEREAEILQALSHSAIPAYLDSFEFDEGASKGFVLVQTYIDASSLEDDLQAGRTFREATVKTLCRELLQILDYLHDRQPPVIHRDLKPSNILLAGDEVYLVDFGSVQTLATREGRTVTVVGTYGYMPPEQFGGIACPASDLYALGATAIALLTGTHPADLPQEGLQLKFEHLAQVTPTFATWLKRMTHLNLEQRFASAQLALAALDNPALIKQTTVKPTTVPSKHLSTGSLFWNALWRSSAMGTIAGCIYSGIYTVMIVPDTLVWGMMTGAFVGAVWGFGLGVLNGFIVGILTRLFFFPLTNPRRHRWFISLVSGVACVSLNYAFIANFIFKTVYLEPLYLLIILGIVPAAIAGISMGVISQSIARWYEKRSRQK